jgi:hypothetical protein
VTIKWLPSFNQSKSMKQHRDSQMASTLNQSKNTKRYRDSQMASSLNQSKSTKMHLIQSQCLNTAQHELCSIALLGRVKFRRYCRKCVRSAKKNNTCLLSSTCFDDERTCFGCCVALHASERLQPQPCNNCLSQHVCLADFM